MASSSGPSPSPDLGGLSSNIISDFGPILSLFGEQVAKQFMSQSMGWLDHIIFAMAPLGIITAIVGAIRVGGSGWLRAIVGRARESYATAEVELMSSTSHEVCEMWNGQNIVRIMGAPAVREVIYSKGEMPRENSVTEEHTCDLHSLEKDDLPSFLTQIRGKSNQKPHATIEGSTESTRDEESGTATKTETIDKNRPRSAPNISLNIHNYVPKWELYLVATIGILLQTAILVYAYLSTYNSAFKLKLGVSSPVIWAWYFTLIGTLGLITGMLGCCYIIEKSTIENTYQVPKGKGEMHILWLQKGETVNDQVFNSHAIFTKKGRSEIMTSRRNDKLTDLSKAETHIFEYTTTAAAFLSLVGFILQFMGLRGMHWSISVAQVLATIIMTISRTVVRRGLSECPHCHELPQKHEMDWLATRFADDDDRSSFWKGPERISKDPAQSIWSKGFHSEPTNSLDKAPEEFWGQGCWRWKVVTGAENSGYELPQSGGSSNNRAQKVVDARKRLGYLTQWPGAYSDKATSIVAAIEHVMNIPNLFASDKKEFLWSMEVDLEEVQNAQGVTPPKINIEFKIEKEASGKWKADLAEIEAVLSLWIFSVSEKEKNNSRPDKKDRKDEFLRSGRASRQQGIRLLGPSTPSSRRDMKWWIGGGLSKVLEVDFSEPVEADSSGSVTDGSGNQIIIKPGDHRIVGFAGGEINSGVYKTQPLSEVPIWGALDEKNTARPAPNGSRLCLAAVSDAPLDLLFAQEMLSAFMWAFAKSPYARQIEGQTKLQPQPEQSSNSTPDWQSFVLQNTTLSKLAQNIESIGLGSLDEVYMSILPPLIAHCRLPDADVLVDNIHQKTKELQLSGSWEKAAEMYLWVFQACSHGTSDSGSTATFPIHEVVLEASTNERESAGPKALIKAAAAFTQFLQALGTEAERSEIQRAPNSREGILDPMKKFRDGLPGLVKRSGDTKVFDELAWLYKRQCRDVDWKPLLDIRDEPNSDLDTTDIKGAKALGLTETHQAFISSQEQFFKWEETTNLVREVHKADVLGWTPLHYAVNIANNVLIQQLLKSGADWRLKDLGGWTPLHYAAASKTADFEVHREHLKERIDLNSQGRDGFSPLHCSAISGNVHMARFLVESGASLQTFDNSRKTPLHWAAYHGFTEIVNLMLGYGASSLACDESGKTPLHLAAIKGSSNVVAAVAKAMGGMVDIRERDGWTAMQIAAFYGHSKVMEILLDCGTDVNSQGGEYGNALQVAIRGGHVEGVVVLLDHGADVNAQGGEYGNALQAAAADGHIEIVRILLDHGANVNVQGGEYGNALQVAARRRHMGVVEMLLDHGAEINAQGGKYGNALQAAATDGHIEAMKMLLDRGADVNAQGGEHWNALQVAVKGGHMKAAEVLLDYRADVNAQGGEYGNALQVAIRGGHTETVEMLLNHGADVNAQGGEHWNALQVAVKVGQMKAMEMLLDHGADVNAQGGVYGNALQAAAWMGNLEAVKVLLDSGANVNAHGGEYRSALQAAVRGGHAEVVKVLLSDGACVDVGSDEHRNTLKAAVGDEHIEALEVMLNHVYRRGEYSNALQGVAGDGNVEVVKALLDRGVDVNTKGGQYANALQAASRMGNFESVKVLVDHGANVNAQGGTYGNALQAAAWVGDVVSVRVLLDHGADVNAEGGLYGNALQAAAVSGNVEVVKLLLDHGADSEVQGGTYKSALNVARIFGNQEIIELLIDPRIIRRSSYRAEEWVFVG